MKVLLSLLLYLFGLCHTQIKTKECCPVIYVTSKQSSVLGPHLGLYKRTTGQGHTSQYKSDSGFYISFGTLKNSSNQRWLLYHLKDTNPNEKEVHFYGGLDSQWCPETTRKWFRRVDGHHGQEKMYFVDLVGKQPSDPSLPDEMTSTESVKKRTSIKQKSKLSKISPSVSGDEQIWMEINCLSDVLRGCCQHPLLYLTGTGSPSTHVDHILGGYEIVDSINNLFAFKQVQPRHNRFQDDFESTFQPVHLYIYQAYYNYGPVWVISEQLLATHNETTQIVANSSLLDGPKACPPMNGWYVKHVSLKRKDEVCPDHHKEGDSENCTPGQSVVTYHNVEEFHVALELESKCLDESWSNKCDQCRVSPNAECKVNQTLKEFQCHCKDGYIGNGISCAKKQGPTQCVECEGLSCSHPSQMDHVRCPPGIYTCQLFVTGYVNLKKLLFRRMCGSGDSTQMECIGIRNDSHHRDFPADNSNVDSTNLLVRERYYPDVPFICGYSFECTGVYTTSKQQWDIKCNQGSQGIRCYKDKTNYTKHSDGQTIVKCVGPTVLILSLDEDQFQKFSFPTIQMISEAAGLGNLMPRPESSTTSKPSTQQHHQVQVPGFTRYFRPETSHLISPYFMECKTAKYPASKQSIHLREGLLCTCDTPLCNNITASQLNEFVSHCDDQKFANFYVMLVMQGCVMYHLKSFV